MLNKSLLLITIIFSNIAFSNVVTSHNNVADITQLMNAVMNNDIDGVEFFSTKEQKIINKQNIGGATALHLAARRENSEIVATLLKNKAKTDLRDQEGWTPLMRAAANCRTKNVELLINAGANIFFNNYNNESALLYATSSRCLKLVTKFKEMSLLKYSFLKLKIFKINIQKSIYIASRDKNSKIKDELNQILLHLDSLYEVKKNKTSEGKKILLKTSPLFSEKNIKIYGKKNFLTISPEIPKNNIIKKKQGDKLRKLQNKTISNPSKNLVKALNIKPVLEKNNMITDKPSKKFKFEKPTQKKTDPKVTLEHKSKKIKLKVKEEEKIEVFSPELEIKEGDKKFKFIKKPTTDTDKPSNKKSIKSRNTQKINKQYLFNKKNNPKQNITEEKPVLEKNNIITDEPSKKFKFKKPTQKKTDPKVTLEHKSKKIKLKVKEGDKSSNKKSIKSRNTQKINKEYLLNKKNNPKQNIAEDSNLKKTFKLKTR